MKRLSFWRSLKTAKTAWAALAVCLVLILLFTSVAALIAHSGTSVVIRNIKIDKRGGILTGELYTPRGVNAEDNLPAVLLAHGGNTTNGVMGGFAQELARRGFVVLSINAYGSGESENPPTDDGGYAPGELFSPRGLHDAYEYLCSIEYVDTTRIGLAGHSMGNIRTGATGAMDGMWYTLNDLLINVLYNEFGIEFTEDEIYEDADTVAEQNLSEDQLKHYEYLKAEQVELFDNRIKAIVGLGGGTHSNRSLDTKTVTVGGHEVERLLNSNVIMIDGRWDENQAEMSYTYDSANMTCTEGILYSIAPQCQVYDGPASEDHVYAIDHTFQAGQSTDLGLFEDLSVLEDEAFAEAVENTSIRGVLIHNETHSQNFLSYETTAMTVKFLEQTLGWNNGDLGSADADPIAYDNIVWFWREGLNGLAMLSMIGMLFAITAIVLKTPFFAPTVCETVPARITKKSKSFWVMALVYIVVSACAVIYVCGLHERSWAFIIPDHTRILGKSWFLPYDSTPHKILGWMLLTNVGSLIAILVNGFVNKNYTIKNYLEDTKLKMPVRNVLKMFLVATLLFLLAYISVEFINRIFYMDYRFWMIGFDVMDARQMFATLRFMLVLTPIFLVSGMFVNSGRMSDMSEGKNTLLHVILSDLGLIILAVIIYSISISQDIPAATTWFCSCFGTLFLVPINTYITRKMYNISGNIWLGAFINAYLVAWVWCSLTDTVMLIR